MAEKLSDDNRRRVVEMATGLAGPSPSGNRCWTAREIEKSGLITFPSGAVPGRTTFQMIIKKSGVPMTKEGTLSIRESESELLTININKMLSELGIRDLSRVKTTDLSKMIEQLIRARDMREKLLMDGGGKMTDTAATLEELAKKSKSRIIVDMKEGPDGSYSTG